MSQVARHWESIIQPYRILVQQAGDEQYKAKITIEHLEPGFGVTVGHALRRVLMSSIQGTAVTRVYIREALHEFSAIPGVKEDVTDFITNLRGIALRSVADRELCARLDIAGPCEAKAKDVQWPGQVEVLNPEHHLAVVSEGERFVVDFYINRGKGYIAEPSSKKADQGLGGICVPVCFNPVRHVHYEVFGQGESKESVVMTIETNGTIAPKDAFAVSAKILQDNFQRLHKFGSEEVHVSQESDTLLGSEHQSLDMKIEELPLNVRPLNCLRKIGIMTIRDLVTCTRVRLLSEPNLGAKSLKEIEEALTLQGLRLGMEAGDIEKLGYNGKDYATSN